MKRTLQFITFSFLLLFAVTSCKKEDDKVIDSFGFMNEKLEESIQLTAVKNEHYKGILERSLSTDSTKYLPIYNRLMEAQNVSNTFFNYLESLKDSIYDGTLEKDEARTEYGKLSNSKFLDKFFFDGDKPTARGKEFLQQVNDYKKNFEKALGRGFGTVATMVTSRFRTKDLIDYSGNTIPWLSFKFKSFPAMASIFNISQMQYDIRIIEQELIDAMNSGEFKKEFAMRNYTGIVRFDKGSYFPDDRITGRIVLGRFDESVKPFDINVNGQKIGDNYGTEGAVLIDLRAPEPGEHTLKGNFKVMYDGTPVTIPFNTTYKVVSRENVQEKIVYKTEYVEKPVYIDRPVGAKSTPKTSSEPAKPKKQYSVGSMEIDGTVNHEKGTVTMLKSTLHQATIGAIRTQDNKEFAVSNFMVKVVGQTTVYVEGSHFSQEAIRTIDKAQPGQTITIFNIKAVDEEGMRQGKVKQVKIMIK